MVTSMSMSAANVSVPSRTFWSGRRRQHQYDVDDNKDDNNDTDENIDNVNVYDADDNKDDNNDDGNDENTSIKWNKTHASQFWNYSWNVSMT